MTKPSILLVGAGGHARACIDVIEQENRFLITGLLGLPEQVEENILGYPVLGTDNDLSSLRERCDHALITIGQIKSPESRMRLFMLLSKSNFMLPCIISPYAYVSKHATIGAGSIVMHNAIVNSGAIVGRNCIINTRSLIEHDVRIDDHCHISTGAIINGGVQIGTETFIGSGSVVREGTTISSKCFIGMGQSITQNCNVGSKLTLANKEVI